MKESFVLVLLLLLSDVERYFLPQVLISGYNDYEHSVIQVYRPEEDCEKHDIVELYKSFYSSALQGFPSSRRSLLLVEAKGVAGLGKAGGENQGGSDKGGQQVPPEVYIALTYAGSAFLLTLSVPLILYALNKLLNKIEDCFGCGPSSKKKKLDTKLKQSAASGTNAFNSNLTKATSPSDENRKLSLSNQSFHNQQLHQLQYSRSHQTPAFASTIDDKCGALLDENIRCSDEQQQNKNNADQHKSIPIKTSSVQPNAFTVDIPREDITKGELGQNNKGFSSYGYYKPM